MTTTKVNLANTVEGILPVANGGTGSSTGVSPGGSTTQVQFNNAGAFGGSANLTFNGTTLTAAALTSTGVATFSAGTVSAPALTTTGDTNTGIFFPAADTIAFTEGGAESMRIDASGNLLVGTTTQVASARLTLSGSATLASTYQQVITDGTRSLRLGVNATAAEIQSTGGVPLYINYGGNDVAMVSQGSGNVGIGTSSPNDRLDIVGGNIRIASGNVIRFVDSGNVRVSIQGDTSSNAIFSTAGTERFRFGSAGQLGIGGANYGTAGQVLTSQGSGSAPVWQFPPVYTADYLVVAGGGGGGFDRGGGGGAGGYIAGSITALQGASYSITVGGGGNGGTGYGNRTSGSSSVFSGVATAVGGGFGADGSGGGGASGGSGGGAGSGGGGGGSGTSGQGNTGGSSGGGSGSGGGGGVGANGGNGGSGNGTGGNGGVGLNWQSLGTFYAGGGGGGAAMDFAAPRAGGSGGNGGGGAGGNTNSQAGTSGTANRGGGGGGGANISAAAGGNGGSGVVIIRYLGGQRASGGTVTSAGGYTYHTFTTSGTFTA